MAQKKEIENENDIIKYSKEQIVNSNKYANRKDLLNSLLEDSRSYSFEEVDTVVDNFMKGTVK